MKSVQALTVQNISACILPQKLLNLADDATLERDDNQNEDATEYRIHPVSKGPLGELILRLTTKAAPTTGPNRVPLPPSSVINTTSPDMCQ